MADTVTPDSIINDSCWNIVSSLDRNPHFLSLKLAEEAAWQLVDQLPRDCRIDLVTINVRDESLRKELAVTSITLSRGHFLVRLLASLDLRRGIK